MVEVVRQGITRTVFLTRRWAVKVPTVRGMGTRDLPGRIAGFARGILANQSEKDWSEVEGLNPVVWTLVGLVNVYRRAEPVADGEVIDYELICPEFVPIGDRKPDNVGYVDGRLVWIDYDYSWNGPRCPACHVAPPVTGGESPPPRT